MNRLFIACLCICIFTSCQTAKNARTTTSEQKKEALPDSLINKKRTGIDFIASGTIPVNWTLEMDFDKQFVFRSSDGNDFLTSSVTPYKSIEGIEVYSVLVTSGKMDIHIWNETCNASITGKINKKVDVKVNSTTYTGCGSYLYNQAINDKWILAYIDNTILGKTDFPKGFPFMNFNLDKNRMSGFDGCNTFNTDFLVQGDRIIFGRLAVTRKTCNTRSEEKTFDKYINNKTVKYLLNESQLIIYLNNDSRLVFLKEVN